MQVANLRFLLRDNSVISCLEQDSLPYFKERITEFVALKNNEKILQTNAKNAISNALMSTKYSFKLNGLDYIIKDYDFYDTCVLEVRFNVADEILEYKMPEFLADFCLENITNDGRYEPISLALFGKPNYTFDFNKILAKAKLLRVFYLYPCGEISAYDAVRVYLYGLLEESNFLILQFLEKKDPKILFKVSNILLANLAILENFGSVFDEKILKTFENSFEQVKEQSKELAKKSFLCDYIKRHDISFNGFKEFVREIEKQNDEMVLKLLDFQNLLKEFAFVLEDTSGFYELDDGKIGIRKFSARVISDFILKLSLDDALKFRNILAIFGAMLNGKINSKLVKRLHKINELMIHCQKCEFLSSELDVPQMKVINSKLKKSLKSTEKKIEKKFKKITKLANEFYKILEIYKEEDE